MSCLGRHTSSATCHAAAAAALLPIAITIDIKIYIRQDRQIRLCWLHGHSGPAALPDTLRSIGQEAFSGCTEIVDLQLPDTLQFGFSAEQRHVVCMP